ncbi:MAG TPA: hypothetical protein VFW66_11505 [Gemmatimonadales bacterium]|nr:hypothetical protein [Gemmatimonadales bacterium]
MAASESGLGQQVRDMKDEALDKGKTSLREAKDRASSRLGERKQHMADRIGGVADAFRRTGDNLRAENDSNAAGIADRVADQAQRAADYVRQLDVRDAKDDLVRFARREPAWVIGGAFAVGLLGARFLKSSEPESRDYEDYGGYRYARTGSGQTASPRTDFTQPNYATGYDPRGYTPPGYTEPECTDLEDRGSGGYNAGV